MSEQEFPVGLTITGVRTLMPEETGRDGPWVCIELSDGSVIYACDDYVNNEPGALCGRLKTGEIFWVG